MGVIEKRNAKLYVILREGASGDELAFKQANKKRKQQLRAQLMQGIFPQMPQRPVINRGLTRGVGFV